MAAAGGHHLPGLRQGGVLLQHGSAGDVVPRHARPVYGLVRAEHTLSAPLSLPANLLAKVPPCKCSLRRPHTEQLTPPFPPKKKGIEDPKLFVWPGKGVYAVFGRKPEALGASPYCRDPIFVQFIVQVRGRVCVCVGVRMCVCLCVRVCVRVHVRVCAHV
jgi:hypothetical protein